MRNRVQTTAFFFDMTVSASAPRRGKPPYEGLQPLSATAIVGHLRTLKEADIAAMRAKSGRVTVYLQDIKIEHDHATFLVNLSDQDAADLAFSNPTAKTRRPITKNLEEGLDASAHVVIRLTQSMPDTYKILIESAPGLPSKKIEKFLNYCLRAAASRTPDDFMVEDPEQTIDDELKVKKIRARMKIRLFGHPSDSLKADIDAGTVGGVELVTREVPTRTWDQNGYVKETSHAITLDTSRINKPTMSSKFGVLSQICVGAVPSNFETMRVKFKTAAGLSRTVVIDTATQTTSDEAYVRKELLHGFTENLLSSYENINSDLASRMKALT